jgi:hypothetical protein
MRDDFGVSIGGAILFGSLLFWICVWLPHGILASTPASGAADP